MKQQKVEKGRPRWLGVLAGMLLLVILACWIGFPRSTIDPPSVMDPIADREASVDGAHERLRNESRRSMDIAPTLVREQVGHLADVVTNDAKSSLEVIVVRERPDSPASGVEVLLLEATNIVPRRAQTDMNGHTTFPDLLPGRKFITTAFGGGLSLDLAYGEVREATLLIPRGREVCARVVDESGAPVPQAELHVTASDSMFIESIVGRTGADGCVRLIDVPLDQRLWATAEGWTPSCRFTVHAIGGNECASISFTLRRAAPRLFAKVVDDVSGDPVARAQVWISSADSRMGSCSNPDVSLLGEPGLLSLTADEHGAFTTMEISAYPVTMAVEVDGYLTDVFSVGAAGMKSEPVILRLHPGGWVKGTCVNTAGQPVPGAMVYANRSWNVPQKVTVADGKGRFTLFRLPLGNLALTAECPNGLIGTTEVEFSHQHPNDDFVIIELSCMNCITGRLETISGKSLGGWLVAVEPERPSSSAAFQGVTYRCTSLADGSFSINALSIADPWILARPLGSDVGWPVVCFRASGNDLGVVPVPDDQVPDNILRLEFDVQSSASSGAYVRLVCHDRDLVCARRMGGDLIVRYRGVPRCTYSVDLWDSVGELQASSGMFVLPSASLDHGYRVTVNGNRLLLVPIRSGTEVNR